MEKIDITTQDGFDTDIKPFANDLIALFSIIQNDISNKLKAGKTADEIIKEIEDML
jgi:hypothetical protein